MSAIDRRPSLSTVLPPPLRRRGRIAERPLVRARSGEHPAPDLGVSEHSAPAPDGAGTRRVLVVDDEPAMRLLCRLNLQLAGYEVLEAADGPAALALLRAERFALVLLDVMMPGLSGFDVAEELRSAPADSRPPIVFVSARADSADIRRGFELGAVDYITKPFDPVELVGRLEALLGAIAAGDGTTLAALRRERIRGDEEQD